MGYKQVVAFVELSAPIIEGKVGEEAMKMRTFKVTVYNSETRAKYHYQSAVHFDPAWR
jgi:hypothetical protein